MGKRTKYLPRPALGLDVFAIFWHHHHGMDCRANHRGSQYLAATGVPRRGAVDFDFHAVAEHDAVLSISRKMRQRNFKTALVLSAIIAMLAAITSLGGLHFSDLYRDSEFIKNAWFANDWVTLVVAVPGLIASMRLVQKGSQRAQLVWMGLLLYMLYNYAFYLFGAAFNEFFLLYVALFTLSGYALIFGLSSLDVNAISQKFDKKTPVLWLGIFLFFLAVPLLVVEGGRCIKFIFNGIEPEAPSLIFALDLSFVVPATILAAVWLWQRRAWGYVLSTMMLVKGVTYVLVLSASALRLFLIDSPERDEFLPFYLFVATGSVVGLTALLRNLRPKANN